MKTLELFTDEASLKRPVRGVLFDMDGLVIDTEKYYTRFWTEAANALGYPMTFEQGLGMRSLNREAGERQLKSYFGEGISYHEVRNKRIEMMDAYIAKKGVEKKPGIDELLAWLKSQGIKTSITTSSPMERIDLYLGSVGLRNSFDEIVSGYMVKNGKPAPDIYEYAAARLGLDPKECIALEDSPAGLLSAYRAGCMPVMIPDQDEPDEETKKLLFAKASSLDVVIELIQKMRN